MEKGKINLYLIRHGETDWNKAGRIQGRQNISLNENGIKQAEDVSKILKDIKIEHIYCSPLHRAIQTAEIIAKNKGIGIEKIEDLQEICFGDEEGRTKEQIVDRYGEEFYEKFSYTTDDLDSSYNNGETKRKVADRFSGAVANILKTTKYNCVAVVAHGFVIRLFLLLNGLGGLRSMSNCCVYHCECENGEVKNIRLI